MRVLLDECVNPKLRRAFPGDQVKTVVEMGWRSLTNGRLMEAAAGHFDVFLTLDKNFRFQNPVSSYTLGIVVLDTQLNTLEAYRPQFADIRDLLKRTKPGQVSALQIRCDR
jgi:hypothetical protein